MSDIVERARHCREWGNFDELHADLLAEVERLQPRRIESVEGLDALPTWSIIQHGNQVWRKLDEPSHQWLELTAHLQHLCWASSIIPLYVVVLWTPEAHR